MGRGNYRYRVRAVDFEENLGAWSTPAIVFSSATGKEPQLTREQKDRPVYADHVRRIHAKGAGKVRKGHATLFGDSLTGATVYPQCAQSAFGTLTVNAFGYPSMRTDFGRNKVGEMLQRDNPEFMFILYGTNNNKAEERIPAAMGDLAAIVKACEANGTVPVLGTIPPRGWTPESAPESTAVRGDGNAQLESLYGFRLSARGLFDADDPTVNVVQPGSVAARAGIVAGDVIESVAGEKLLDRGVLTPSEEPD